MKLCTIFLVGAACLSYLNPRKVNAQRVESGRVSLHTATSSQPDLKWDQTQTGAAISLIRPGASRPRLISPPGDRSRYKFIHDEVSLPFEPPTKGARHRYPYVLIGGLLGGAASAVAMGRQLQLCDCAGFGGGTYMVAATSLGALVGMGIGSLTFEIVRDVADRDKSPGR